MMGANQLLLLLLLSAISLRHARCKHRDKVTETDGFFRGWRTSNLLPAARVVEDDGIGLSRLNVWVRVASRLWVGIIHVLWMKLLGAILVNVGGCGLATCDLRDIFHHFPDTFYDSYVKRITYFKFVLFYAAPHNIFRTNLFLFLFVKIIF